MDSIVNKINNQWGLNPYYEIWNEPENYYWQGTTAQYHTFFKNTFKAIKLNHPTALVGGPVVASFSSCFNLSLPKGHLTNSQYNQTIIANVIDSCVSWNIKLDFISWHKFDPLLQSVNEEILYLNQKLLTSGHGIVPYIVSEHNQTSSLRDTYFSNASVTSNILNIEKMGVLAHSVAAWQDFDSSNTEFHKDYGVLSWNSLHKPVWKSLQLLNRLKGNKLKNYCSDSLNISVAASYNNDTVRTFISNYQLPAFAETKSYLYYLKNFNSTDFAAEGLASDNHLDSIFRGLIVLPSTSLLSQSINQAIPFYNRADSMFKFGRTINLHFKGLTGIHSANLYMVDSIQNNIIYKYDSLITNGYTRNSAVTFLYPNNTISFKTITISDSIYSFHLKSNSVALIEALIQNPQSIYENLSSQHNFKIYPNPSKEKIFFEVEKGQSYLHTFQIFNTLGECVREAQLVNRSELDVSNLSEGLYIIQVKEYPSQKQKFIKVN
ncbi:MAG: T9SS type A sorting domain-containing protein [Bacteroidetes bacterium]|nr:T9SS type A sorting domain-containing protein [Bacteroidota bacterium]